MVQLTIDLTFPTHWASRAGSVKALQFGSSSSFKVVSYLSLIVRMPSEPVSPKAYRARSRTSYQSEASNSVGTAIRVDFHRFGFALESGNPTPSVAAKFKPALVVVLGIPFVDSCVASRNESLLSVSGG